MTHYLTLSYVCPHCGYVWEDNLTDTFIADSTCQCPSCEEPVCAVVNR